MLTTLRKPSTVAALAAVLAAPAAAQVLLDGVEELDFDRPESWAMKYFTSVTQLSGFGTPRGMKPGAVDLELEAGWVPSLDDEERSVGFFGTKAEDLNRADVFGRLRGTVGLPRRLSLTVGWVPPVEVDGVEPNLISLALGRPIVEAQRFRVGLRLHGQVGRIEGDLTCSSEAAAAGDDPRRNPFGCLEPSNDTLETTYVGLEVSTAWKTAGGRIEPFVAASINALDLEFQIRARWSNLIDRTLQLTDGTTVSLTAGAAFAVTDRLSLAGEAFYAPLEVVRAPAAGRETDELFNLRTMIRYTLR